MPRAFTPSISLQFSDASIMKLSAITFRNAASNAAYDLLQKKGISLCEIAYECGFADQSHFTRVFKRRVGVTPGVFRSSLD